MAPVAAAEPVSIATAFAAAVLWGGGPLIWATLAVYPAEAPWWSSGTGSTPA